MKHAARPFRCVWLRAVALVVPELEAILAARGVFVLLKLRRSRRIWSTFDVVRYRWTIDDTDRKIRFVLLEPNFQVTHGLDHEAHGRRLNWVTDSVNDDVH